MVSSHGKESRTGLLVVAPQHQRCSLGQWLARWLCRPHARPSSTGMQRDRKPPSSTDAMCWKFKHGAHRGRCGRPRCPAPPRCPPCRPHCPPVVQDARSEHPQQVTVKKPSLASPVMKSIGQHPSRTFFVSADARAEMTAQWGADPMAYSIREQVRAWIQAPLRCRRGGLRGRALHCRLLRWEPARRRTQCCSAVRCRARADCSGRVGRPAVLKRQQWVWGGMPRETNAMVGRACC